jgi:hypothetical protein
VDYVILHHRVHCLQHVGFGSREINGERLRFVVRGPRTGQDRSDEKER